MDLINEFSQECQVDGAKMGGESPQALRNLSSSLGVIPTPTGRAVICRSVKEIAPELRREAFADQCKDFRYYEILEETLRDKFDYHYLVLENAQTGERSIQPFFFVDQDLTAGLPGGPRALLGKIRNRFPRFLNLRMLMVGCAAGEGQLHNTAPWAMEALHEALGIFARQSKASLILLKDFPSVHRNHLVPFSSNGYRRVPSMPAAKLDLNFSSFEEYMQTRLSRVFRKSLRRKFKQSASFPALEMSVHSDITSMVDEIYPLYQQTLSRAEFSFEVLTKEFLCRLGQEMPDRVRFFVWRQNGKAVAFNLCMVHEGVLYDIDIGLDYSIALDMHLYFITWRDIIQWAVDNQFKTYYTAQLNYDPKYHFRLELAPLDLYACHTSALINPIFRLALQFLQPARHDPILKKFRNAQDL